MNDLSAHFRAALWWLLPLAALVAMLGWEVRWGSGLRLRPPAEAPLVPKPVTTALLPEYTIAGGVAARSETVNRTLFNPTRRPAPAAVAEVAKPRIVRGQFTLTGTTLAGDRSLAFLKETNGGKSRTVKQGDTVNGMLVAEVKSDRVRLTQADDFEEIMLKVVTNPKPTPQPVAPPPQPGQPGQPPQQAQQAQPGQPGQRPSGAQPVAQPPANPGQPQDAAQTLAERRRAARAAEAARQAQQAQQPDASGAAPAAAPAATPDAGWSQIYQRYQQRRQ